MNGSDFLAVPTLSFEQGYGFTYGAAAAMLNLGGMARAAWVSVGVGARRYLRGGYTTRWLFGRRLGLGIQGRPAGEPQSFAGVDRAPLRAQSPGRAHARSASLVSGRRGLGRGALAPRPRSRA